MISEANIINKLKAASCGFIGDDAAVIPIGPDSSFVITKDVLLENIHFRTSYFSPQDLAHKALHVNLSDIAAMGATPKYVMCGISIPPHLSEYVAEFLDSFLVSLAAANVTLIGGDTTAAKDHLFISITAIGEAKNYNIKLRSTAHNGDVICIAGNLGDAGKGLIALESNTQTLEHYIQSFLRPTAKQREGIWFGLQSSITSMMDVSDGLYIDLSRLCESSNCGASLELEQLEQYLKDDILLLNALQGGEDYSLLLTVKPDNLDDMLSAFKKEFGYELKVIGHITTEAGVHFKKDGAHIQLDLQPFTHFGEDL